MLNIEFAKYAVIWSRRDQYIYNPLFLMRLAERKMYLPARGRINSTEAPYPSPYHRNDPIQDTPKFYPRNILIDDSHLQQHEKRADNDLSYGVLQTFADIEEPDWEWREKEPERLMLM